jgi:hypothetical protein
MGSTEARADRVKEIRAALGITQPQFADLLNATALELGLETGYTPLNVSQRETARLELDVEDYVVLTKVDPHHRGLLWLAFGRELPDPKYLGMMPKPGNDGTGKRPEKPTGPQTDAGRDVPTYRRRHGGK